MMNKKKIRSVIFDLDGTLVDAFQAVTESLNYALKHLGYKCVDHQTVKRSVGEGDRILISKFFPSHHVDDALEFYRHHHSKALVQSTILLPQAYDVLNQLKDEGLQLAIATNRPQTFTLAIVQHLQVDHLFDEIICADMIDNPKPEPDMLIHILNKLSLEAHEALFVGDMGIDVMTGQKALVKTVAVLTGVSYHEEIVALKPYYIASQLQDVFELVQKLNSE